MTDIIHTIEVVPPGHHQTNAGILPNEWTSRPLCSVVEEITETAGTKKIETVSISAGIGFVNQAEKFGKELSGKQYEKYTVLHRGDFSYNKGNSNLYPQGCIYRLKDRTEAAVPNVFESFRVVDGDPDYYEQLFTSGFLNKQLYSRINRGVRDDGLLNLRGKDFYSCEVPCPPLAEQKHIAEILMQCDKVIELKQKRIEEEKKKKKWLMQSLFDTLSLEYPQERIDKLTQYIDYRGKTPQKSTSGVFLVTAKNIKMGHIDYDASQEYVAPENYEHVMQRGKPRLGDVVITTEAPCGNVAQIDNPEIALAQRVILLRAKGSITNEYLCLYLQSDTFQKQLRVLQTGLTAQGIKGATLHRMSIPVPTITYQNKICAIVSQQNRLLRNLENELDFYKKKKNALMQLLLTGIVRTKV